MYVSLPCLIDERIWGIHSNGIVTEVNGELRFVAYKSKAYLMGSPRKASDGSIHFLMTNKKTDSPIYYSLARYSSPAQCQIPLNSKKPFVLGSEE